MFTFINFLKVSLPLATVTSVTLATTLLVSSEKKDINEKNKESNLVLSNFEKEIKEFKEREIFYSDKGTAKGEVSLNEDESQKMKDLMSKGAQVSDKGGNLDEVQLPPDNKAPQTDSNEELQSKAKEANSEVSLPPTNEEQLREETTEQEISLPSQNSNLASDNEDSAEESQEATGKAIKEEGAGDVQDLNPAGNPKTQLDEGDSLGEEEIPPQIPEDNVDSLQQEEGNVREAGGDREQESELAQKSEEDEESRNESGDSSKTRVDLDHLKELENRLNSSKDALSSILSSFSL